MGNTIYIGSIDNNYSNVNVKAYTESMGFQNYGNVNVAAYTQTQSYTNYSNVNLAAYLGGAVTIGGNLTVTGNLTVNGNTLIINANNLSINDSMIYLAEENPADTVDIGFTAHVVNPELNHVGFIRDATDSTWKLFSNVAAQPTTTIDFTGANYANLLVGNIQATYFTGNGAFLTGLPAGYSNVNAATFLASGTLTTAIKTAGTVGFTSEFDNGNSGSSYTINFNNGQKQRITLTAAPCTLSFTAPTVGVGNFLLKIIQDGGGSKTITWPATVKWPNGTAPTLSTAAGAVDIVSLYYDGTNYYSVASLNFS
jgi:hypothetical protein